mgnify:FL=1|tara:strand:+ start:655 stop:1254 length:600 start_codon:yes stop_codon:yes gene_type:complete
MSKLEEIKVKVEEQESGNIKISVKEPEPEEIKVAVKPVPYETIELDVRKTLDNNYIIYDHPLFDIVINPDKKRITTFIKRYLKTDPYPHQDVFFDYLLRKGVILPDSVKGGNIFGSLEATYPANKKIDVLKGILLSIYFYLIKELPRLRAALDYDLEVDDSLTDPSEEDSTEYGEVPQKKRKGTMDPFYTQHYGLLYRI